MRTEPYVHPFRLPRGLVDVRGDVHRIGGMRAARAADEIAAMGNARVLRDPGVLMSELLARTVTALGTLREITPDVMDDLFIADRSHLQDLYLRINGPMGGTASARCPRCASRVHLDLDDVDALVPASARPSTDRLLDDAALLAATFHWSLDAILDLPHRDRRTFVGHAASLDQRGAPA